MHCNDAMQCNAMLQVPDWHPGVPQANQEIYDPTSWVANMINWYKKLVTDYPGVVGKLIVDLINVRPASVPTVLSDLSPFCIELHILAIHWLPVASGASFGPTGNVYVKICLILFAPCCLHRASRLKTNVGPVCASALHDALHDGGGNSSALVAVYHLEMLWPVLCPVSPILRPKSISGHALPCVAHT